MTDRTSFLGPDNRRNSSLVSDERGVSTTLSYVLTLTITALLASGLLISAGAFVENRQEETARDELDVIGQQLTARLMAADRLAASGAENVTVRMQFPETVAGSQYTIEVQPGSDRIVLNTTSIDATARVTYTTRTSVSAVRVNGGNLEIVLSGGNLEVRAA